MEVAAAVLAEVLTNNGIQIDCDKEVISWPFGSTSLPPNSGKAKNNGKAKGKGVKSDKSGVIFGVLVNKAQREILNNFKDHNNENTDKVLATMTKPNNEPSTSSGFSGEFNDENKLDGNSQSITEDGHVGLSVCKVKG